MFSESEDEPILVWVMTGVRVTGNCVADRLGEGGGVKRVSVGDGES